MVNLPLGRTGLCIHRRPAPRLCSSLHTQHGAPSRADSVDRLIRRSLSLDLQSPALDICPSWFPLSTSPIRPISTHFDAAQTQGIEPSGHTHRGCAETHDFLLEADRTEALRGFALRLRLRLRSPGPFSRFA